ncbi:unnamed protein product [Rhodiola kirilowii]
MEPDWDLHAVVRGFAAINKSTNTTESAPAADHSGSSGQVFSSNRDVVKQIEEQKLGFCSTNLAVAEELHELYSPYMLNPGQIPSVQPTISSYVAALQAYRKRTEHKGHQSYRTISTSKHATTTTASSAAPHSHKPKRRKNQLKKVCHVPAEALSSDIWSWRKYGQKPIKGSPYPRGYYKCSSSKACLARKQVERNRSDPTMFIVTYTADHNHPAPTHKNSLAGTTRNPNPLSSTSSTAHDESNTPTSKLSSSSSTATMSPAGSPEDEVLQQSNEMESQSTAVDMGGDISKTNLVDDVMGFLDMDVTDDFFEDLGDFTGPPMDNWFPDQIPPGFPWITNNGSTKGDMN